MHAFGKLSRYQKVVWYRAHVLSTVLGTLGSLQGTAVLQLDLSPRIPAVVVPHPCIIIPEQVLPLTFPACRLAESLGQEDAGDYSLEDSSDSQRLKHKGVGFLPRICPEFMEWSPKQLKFLE